ncbi:MAG TPA: sigma 54-interacting transcriptional regulator [Haliangiales bacterium]|nr:sigma 54-interacting transcriptional regulator [Haliangiales bacterium]
MEKERAPATTIIGQRERPTALAIRGFTLEVAVGPDAGRVGRIEKRSALIGTHPSSDLVLSDPHVSRLHARVDVEDDEYVLTDLGSTNGTRVGGVRVRQACLEDGTLIELGQTQARFRLLGQSFEIELAPSDFFEGLAGRSVAMRELFALLARVAPTDATVLLEGETGTGKELVARAIHTRSGRHERPLVVFDCGAAPPTLIESELFGHERGAFTGAVAARAGVFERANGGTVLIDELGELTPELQPKLLRVLETGEVMRVGGEKALKVDVRVVAATHRDLARHISEGRFRADLYYRLAVIRVRIPPLRERRDDIPLLAACFVRDLLGDVPATKMPAAALEGIFSALRHHDWPGNVRELRNVVERAAILADPKLMRQAALEAAGELARSVEKSMSKRVTLRAARAEHEREYLTDLLRATEGDLDEASRVAQVHRKSLERLIRKHKLRGGT